MAEIMQLWHRISSGESSAWDQFVSTHPAAHLLQTHAWGELKSQFEWRHTLVTLPDGQGGIQAGALLLYRRAAGLKLAYAPKGPLVDWQDRPVVMALLRRLHADCQRQGASLLKIEPDLPDTPTNRALLQSYGFRPSPQSIQPRSTTIINIAGPEEAIMQRMKSKWRYNIRLAERKGVTVRVMERGDLPAFHRLMRVTGQRDGFAVHSDLYYQAAFNLLTPHHAVFLLAEYQTQPLAAIVVGCSGQSAWYLWGASGDQERNRMPNHALQWAGIQWARTQGATRYDFWGIPDDLGQVAVGLRGGDGSGVPVDELPVDLEAFPHHDLWGVYRFKQGFGGQVVRFVGAWDLPINEFSYRLYTAGLAGQAELKKIRKVGLRSWLLPAQSQPTPLHATHNRPELQPIDSVESWNTTLAALPTPHVLQSWEWGAVKSQTEWQAERFALLAGTQPVAAFQFLWRQPLPYLPLRVGYVPKGPAVDWENLDLVAATLNAIEQQARRLGCIFVKIDPDVREDQQVGQLVLHMLHRRGWRYSQDQVQFKNTAHSDLRQDTEQLLAAMKSKWRYNIRLAERRGIRVRLGDCADLSTFYKLYAETGARDGFLIRPLSYYQTTWQTFLTAQAQPGNPTGGALLLAEHPEEQEPVAGLFLMRYGRCAWYFYGASSERQRRDMPNYLLQWHALRWASSQGCTRYDWWGAPTQIDNESDAMQGVWQFKQGFGATFQPQVGAWDFPVSTLLYQLYTEAMPRLLDLLRRRHRRQRA